MGKAPLREGAPDCRAPRARTIGRVVDALPSPACPRGVASLDHESLDVSASAQHAARGCWVGRDACRRARARGGGGARRHASAARPPCGMSPPRTYGTARHRICRWRLAPGSSLRLGGSARQRGQGGVGRRAAAAGAGCCSPAAGGCPSWPHTSAAHLLAKQLDLEVAQVGVQRDTLRGRPGAVVGATECGRAAPCKTHAGSTPRGSRRSAPACVAGAPPTCRCSPYKAKRAAAIRRAAIWVAPGQV